jgi:hypothetical protein
MDFKSTAKYIREMIGAGDIKMNEKELNKINTIINKCNYEINLNLKEEIYKNSEIEMFFIHLINVISYLN